MVPVGQLPALLHAFAFGVLALMLLAPWPRAWLPATWAWAAALVLAECLQASPAGSAVAEFPGGALWRAHVSGTFDPLDVAASVGGALAALLWFSPAARPAGEPESGAGSAIAAGDAATRASHATRACPP
jgi:hypothetical protein